MTHNPHSIRYLARGFSGGIQRKLTLRFDEEQALASTPSGHYRGSPGIDEHLVTLALTDDGSQLTLTPAEFAKRFGWKNDAGQVPDLTSAGKASAIKAN